MFENAHFAACADEVRCGVQQCFIQLTRFCDPVKSGTGFNHAYEDAVKYVDTIASSRCQGDQHKMVAVAYALPRDGPWGGVSSSFDNLIIGGRRSAVDSMEVINANPNPKLYEGFADSANTNREI